MQLTDKEPSNNIEHRAALLAKVLTKHNPVEMKEAAMALMQKLDKGSDAFKVCAFAYEVADVLK